MNPSQTDVKIHGPRVWKRGVGGGGREGGPVWDLGKI